MNLAMAILEVSEKYPRLVCMAYQWTHVDVSEIREIDEFHTKAIVKTNGRIEMYFMITVELWSEPDEIRELQRGQIIATGPFVAITNYARRVLTDRLGFDPGQNLENVKR